MNCLSESCVIMATGVFVFDAACFGGEAGKGRAAYAGGCQY